VENDEKLQKKKSKCNLKFKIPTFNSALYFHQIKSDRLYEMFTIFFEYLVFDFPKKVCEIKIK
jgi:hypothetical protein